MSSADLLREAEVLSIIWVDMPVVNRIDLHSLSQGMIRTVTVAASAAKDLKRCPLAIRQKLFVWVASVESIGLEQVRRQPGWHDEPLKGQRRGQRSIRLNRQWRAIYVLLLDGRIEFCEAREVTSHDGQKEEKDFPTSARGPGFDDCRHNLWRPRASDKGDR